MRLVNRSKRIKQLNNSLFRMNAKKKKKNMQTLIPCSKGSLKQGESDYLFTS